MTVRLLVPFPEGPEADTREVGGKGASLFRMQRAGLSVPPGVVLTTAFFAPWYAALRETDAWNRLVAAPAAEWGPHCRALKDQAADLPLGEPQRAALDALLARRPGGALHAVRSSSPEEDLASASFAGAYETRLGVPVPALEEAIRACFASSLDLRVLTYKRERSLDPFAPQIAVIVQEQVRSEVAGVGFSLDPVTNDFDHAVFGAAWGLGEPVVSGEVSPDHFVVDKVAGRVVERRAGAKQRALHVRPEGGTVTSYDDRSEALCLDDAQLTSLTEVIGRVEELFGAPVDVEWAWAEGTLHLLQARPITTWVPLPPELMTAPGARRRLYMDLGLSGGLTINAPISPLGQSWMTHFAGLLVDTYLGPLPFRIGKEDALWFLCGGRMYQDLSNVLWLSTPRLLAVGQRSLDALMAASLASIDARTYRASKRPSWVSPWLVFLYPRAVWRARGMLGTAARSLLFPDKARVRLDAEVRAFEAELGTVSAEQSLPELLAAHGERVIRFVLETTMPPLLVSMAAVGLAQWIVPRRLRPLGERLARGFEGNVVVEMGLALHQMARLLGPERQADPAALAERLRKGELSPPFMSAWQAFVDRYGWRGPHEMDVARPRYADEPALALSQLGQMNVEADLDPAQVHARHVQERQDAYATLMRELGPFRRALLRLVYRWIDRFAGTRDTPKHCYLLFFAAVRRRAMLEGRRLAERGRLDAPEDVMGLTLEEVEAARRDPALDLRKRREENTRFLDKLRVHVKAFPAIIDSRGRIQQPAPRPEPPGTLSGMAVSPGVVLGPVKVLHDPAEKPLRAGEILVAHTTDPGWTPLFVNAAGVVLEVGGVLQHGAVVAREYGKPCVAGISNLLSRLKDGQQVEVDGSAGVVRVLDDPSAAAVVRA